MRVAALHISQAKKKQEKPEFGCRPKSAGRGTRVSTDDTQNLMQEIYTYLLSVARPFPRVCYEGVVSIRTVPRPPARPDATTTTILRMDPKKLP